MKYCKNCGKKYRQKQYLLCHICGGELIEVKEFIFCKINLINGNLEITSNNYEYLSQKYSDGIILKNIERLLKNYGNREQNISITTCFSDCFVNYLEIHIPIVIKTNQGFFKSNSIDIENVSNDFILKLIEWNKKQGNNILNLHGLKKDYERAKSLVKLYENIPDEEKLKLELEDN